MCIRDRMWCWSIGVYSNPIRSHRLGGCRSWRRWNATGSPSCRRCGRSNGSSPRLGCPGPESRRGHGRRFRFCRCPRSVTSLVCGSRAIGSRIGYLEGGIRYNSIQLVDMGPGGGIAHQYQRRSMINVVEFFLEHGWSQLSIPLAISVDNAFSKTSHLDNFWTLFVRLCLFFGVEPVISPPRELGWTNGVENFNNLFQERTIAKRRYSSLELLAGDSDLFNHWANYLRPLHLPAVAGTRYPGVLVDNVRDTLR